MTTGSGAPVVLVVGRPAVGKTTLSRRIADRFGLPLLAKDDFKELLLDALGSGSREWSMRVGRAAFAVLGYAVERQLAARVPFVVDANYDPSREEAVFQAWQAEYGFRAVQVHCVADPDVLVQRFAARARSGERHPGHADAGSIEAFRASLGDGRAEVLALRGPVLTFDAGDPHATETLLAALAPLLR